MMHINPDNRQNLAFREYSGALAVEAVPLPSDRLLVVIRSVEQPTYDLHLFRTEMPGKVHSSAKYIANSKTIPTREAVFCIKPLA